MSDCCKSGFAWGGQPIGRETTLANNKTYVTGSSKSVAIMILHDAFGWTFTNLRVLADHFAKEIDATVYLPDFLGGEAVPEEVVDDPVKWQAFDINAFLARNSKDIRYPEIVSCAKALKSQYTKVGAIGYCYGGWGAFRLGSDPTLVDCISTAHPTILEKSEIEKVKVPTQILAPEIDQMYTMELKEFSNRVIPTLNIPYEYIFFPGLVHGFAARGDPTNKLQKDGLERAKRSAVNFFKEFLH